MDKNSNAAVEAPAIVHSEKGEGFHNMFKEQLKKLEYNYNRVQVEETPYDITEAYRRNYDDINWRSAGHSLKKYL